MKEFDDFLYQNLSDIFHTFCVVGIRKRAVDLGGSEKVVVWGESKKPFSGQKY